MRPDHSTGERQSQTGSTLIMLAIANRVERLNRRFDLFRGHADPGIGNLDDHLTLVCQTGADRNRAALWRELDRIGDQINQHLAQGSWIGLQARQMFRKLRFQDDPGIQNPWCDKAFGRFDQPRGSRPSRC